MCVCHISKRNKTCHSCYRWPFPCGRFWLIATQCTCKDADHLSRGHITLFVAYTFSLSFHVSPFHSFHQLVKDKFMLKWYYYKSTTLFALWRNFFVCLLSWKEIYIVWLVIVLWILLNFLHDRWINFHGSCCLGDNLLFLFTLLLCLFLYTWRWIRHLV